MRNGTIMRATRRLHVSGHKHQSRLRVLVERERRETEEWICRFEHEVEQRVKQLKSNDLHLLMLSIVATRLRAQYASVEGARLAWRLDSQCLLRRLDNEPIESAILEPTVKAVAATQLRSIAQDSHVLVELISEHM